MPADLYGTRFYSSFRTSAIWIWVKRKLGRLGKVAARGAELLAGVGIARRKAWPKYRFRQQGVVILLNFVLGAAKLAIWKT